MNESKGYVKTRERTTKPIEKMAIEKLNDSNFFVSAVAYNPYNNKTITMKNASEVPFKPKKRTYRQYTRSMVIAVGVAN